MKTSEYALKSFVHAGGTFTYVLGIATFINNAKALFGPDDKFLTPVLVLLLFIVSASITGSLVLGKPILLYLDNHKKEAFTLFFATLGWLVVFLLAVAIILLLY